MTSCLNEIFFTSENDMELKLKQKLEQCKETSASVDLYSHVGGVNIINRKNIKIFCTECSKNEFIMDDSIGVTVACSNTVNACPNEIYFDSVRDLDEKLNHSGQHQSDITNNYLPSPYLRSISTKYLHESTRVINGKHFVAYCEHCNANELVDCSSCDLGKAPMFMNIRGLLVFRRPKCVQCEGNKFSFHPTNDNVSNNAIIGAEFFRTSKGKMGKAFQKNICKGSGSVRCANQCKHGNQNSSGGNQSTKKRKREFNNPMIGAGFFSKSKGRKRTIRELNAD